jgi:hypothetical protein
LTTSNCLLFIDKGSFCNLNSIPLLFICTLIFVPCCALNITFFYHAFMTCTFALQLVKGIDLNLMLILFVYILIFFPFRVLGTFNPFEFSPTFVYLQIDFCSFSCFQDFIFSTIHSWLARFTLQVAKGINLNLIPILFIYTLIFVPCHASKIALHIIKGIDLNLIPLSFVTALICLSWIHNLHIFIAHNQGIFLDYLCVLK